MLESELLQSVRTANPPQLEEICGGSIRYTVGTFYPTHVLSNQRVRGPSTFQSREKTGNKGNRPTMQETQTADMLERSGRLHEDSGLYERQDRTEVGLRKGEFLSHRWGYGDGGRAGG